MHGRRGANERACDPASFGAKRRIWSAQSQLWCTTSRRPPRVGLMTPGPSCGRALPADGRQTVVGWLAQAADKQAGSLGFADWQTDRLGLEWNGLGLIGRQG